MSPWHDLVDWVGGYPFEVAGPETVVDTLEKKGYDLVKLIPSRGHGNNQYVFRRVSFL
jgi:2-polyprenyl-6-hydroxyphenyl methylase/3-demethylubiquinone-9 3-methyltransferase